MCAPKTNRAASRLLQLCNLRAIDPQSLVLHSTAMKIAIIGAGISGLGAAYLLARDHEITIYEKNNYAGGHSRTVDVPGSGGPVPVDTGFIVFNNWNYPNLLGLFRALDVPYQKSDMSFGVSINDGWLEYASGGLLAQKRNLLRPQYWCMIADILRFNKNAPAYIEKSPSISLRECLDELGMGAWFRRYYILAMGASIWSCPVETILEFPARTFLQFFKNHGLLSIKNRPQWYTVTGGSREYVKKLVADFPGNVKLAMPAQRVFSSHGGKVEVEDAYGGKEIFDHVIFACHADEALEILQNPTPDQFSVMAAFRYQENRIVLHGDISFMPRRRKCWASWIYISQAREDKSAAVSLSYWMNNLQKLETEEPLIVTLNPGREPDPDLIYDRHTFSHPIFDSAAIEAQGRIPSIQGKNNIWFCGAYQRYGFHEDGLLSAVNVAKSLGADVPWE